MEQREKLIDLLYGCFIGTREVCEALADKLIANGVVVLPCRCVECKYKDGEDYIPLTLTHGDYIWCNLYDATMPTDGFCSHGKRKGGDE